MHAEKPTLKTPITYYGGKQKLCKTIVAMIPQHTLYAEPFVGGAAVFFAKTKSEVEVINDTNRELVNFYRVVQMDFVALEMEIRISLHSRDMHRKASVVYNNPDMFSEVKRAWAVWVLAHMSFSSIIEGFTEELAIRLQDVQIECTDALRIIDSRDTEGSFFYVDPPYFNSDCGHYDGYSKDDFENLLKVLSKIQGKFLLSSYPSDILSEYTARFGWKQKSLEQHVSVNKGGANGKRKIEVLTWNY